MSKPYVHLKNPYVLPRGTQSIRVVYLPHHTDTHLHVFTLTLAFTSYNKLPSQVVCHPWVGSIFKVPQIFTLSTSLSPRYDLPETSPDQPSVCDPSISSRFSSSSFITPTPNTFFDVVWDIEFVTYIGAPALQDSGKHKIVSSRSNDRDLPL